MTETEVKVNNPVSCAEEQRAPTAGTDPIQSAQMIVRDGTKTLATSAESQQKVDAQRPQIARMQELMASVEFRSDLMKVKESRGEEKTCGLEIGRIAAKWIGNARYSHVLNSARFAACLKKQTGDDVSRKTVETYLLAYREHRFHESRGEQFRHLGASHLAQIGRSRCRDDEERLELARRADVQQVSVRQIRHLAQQLHQEFEQRLRVVDLEPTHCHVRLLDGLDLIREKKDKSIQCIICDWQWAPVTWGGYAEFPAVHVPEDPVGHLCSCLMTAGEKLANDGMVFLFHTLVGLLDRRIEDAWLAAGLKHAGQLIWQKTCGAIMNGGTPLAVAHEHVHILCRREWTPRSACGYVASVTAKWAAPTNAHSGRQNDAVHPHEKPVALMELLISLATHRGLVIDPFAGSGAAGIAAVRRGCEYCGAECIPEYAAIANRRIAMATDKTEEIHEAVQFLLASANEEQRAVITRSLGKSGLVCASPPQQEAA
jgi:hypothetical protein